MSLLRNGEDMKFEVKRFVEVGGMPRLVPIPDPDGVVRWPITWSEALEAAIEKWDTIVKFSEADPETMILSTASSTCALCRLVAQPLLAKDRSRPIKTGRPVDFDCDTCLVVRKGGGSPGCQDTPYELWSCSFSPKHARRELEYLKGLRRYAREMDRI